MPDNDQHLTSDSLSTGFSELLKSKAQHRGMRMNEAPEGLTNILNNPQDNLDAPKIKPEKHEGVVALIDALGTATLMKSTEDDNTVEKVYSTTIGMVQEFQISITELKNTIEGIKDMVISDSFVIAVPYNAEAIRKLMECLAKFQYKCLALYSQVLRGAVSKGMIIGNIPENRIIGPAFIAAHETEKEIAFFPRIVIDRQIFEDDSLKLKEGVMPIAVDKDGIRYVDFLRDEQYEQITTIVDIECKKHENKPKVLQKWHWLKTFLEQKETNRLNCCSSLSCTRDNH